MICLQKVFADRNYSLLVIFNTIFGQIFHFLYSKNNIKNNVENIHLKNSHFFLEKQIFFLNQKKCS